MPIFFNTASHLWIVYLFFVNGALLHWILRGASPGYARLTIPLEAQVLAAFFISISLNALAMLLVAAIGFSFYSLILGLPVLSLILVMGFTLTVRQRGISNLLEFNVCIIRSLLYGVVFVILFYNGGLIERIADSWWHMSMANKIGIANSLDPRLSHLDGISRRYYPPMWHGNLALAHLLSGISIPVFWNSFTAWGGVLKVMAFYLFALALSKSNRVALMSAVLFVLLPGMSYSFLRVSAWPSHIAFAAWFALYYVVFRLLDHRPSLGRGIIRQLFDLLVAEKASILIAVVLLAIILSTHQLEALWFALSIFFYWLALVFVRVWVGGASVPTEPNLWWFELVGVCFAIMAIGATTWLVFVGFSVRTTEWDLVLSYLLPVTLFSGVLIAQLWLWNSSPEPLKSWFRVSILVMFGMLLFSIDLKQLYSLFDPSAAYPMPRYPQSPLQVRGIFGGMLELPGWHLQLRAALLYSGIISVPLALAAALIQLSRATLFLAANASMVLIICTSPYLYQWLSDVLYYHSAWRIAGLIFHPIIFASLFWLLVDILQKRLHDG